LSERDGKSPKGRRQSDRATASPASDTPISTGKSERLRLRAAWMYYVEEMTQNEIADALGIGRVTVVRLLADARARHEVRVSVVGQLAELTALERGLEQRFGIERVIVAPLSHAERDPVPAISATVGAYLSEIVRPDTVVGLGWGRTLLQSLPFMSERSLDNLRVISLLGGVAQVRRFNPTEFVWRFAQIFGGDAYLLAAPAVVDSVETKRTLIEKCGLGTVMDMASELDLAVLSVGAIQGAGTTFRVGYLSEELRKSLIEAGAVGDLLFHYFDRDGRMVDHPFNDLVMSVGIDRVCRAKERILASGGPEKIDSLRGGIALVRPTVFITDEASARALLAQAD
jgi:DNA-binding transcriptional regulator LsrR (DeoR family)